jgi:hypothetical protein
MNAPQRGTAAETETTMRTPALALANAILDSRNGYDPNKPLADSIRDGTVSDHHLTHFIAQWAKWATPKSARTRRLNARTTVAA